MVKRATNSEANMKTQIEEVKFFEQAFEALPQLILSATFYYNHMEYVDKCDTQVPIIELPMTLLSMMFSSGTVLMGIGLGILTIKNVIKMAKMKGMWHEAAAQGEKLHSKK